MTCIFFATQARTYQTSSSKTVESHVLKSALTLWYSKQSSSDPFASLLATSFACLVTTAGKSKVDRTLRLMHLFVLGCLCLAPALSAACTGLVSFDDIKGKGRYQRFVGTSMCERTGEGRENS